MFNLFTTRRFLPLFITQFLAAFNDNLFKNALIIMITYRIAAADSAQAALLVNSAFGLFILPSFLFSALAGDLADKYDRAQIARSVKVVEIVLTCLGTAGLASGSMPLLLATLFGFGTHAAFFGTVKYAILPQHLAATELLTGNALIEAGTFLAILTGTLLGGLLILQPAGIWLLAPLMIGLAICGAYVSRWIPAAPGADPDLKISLNIPRGTWALLRFSMAKRDIRLCILGISWFWFMGSIFLAQFAPFAKDVLHADGAIVTLFLTVFSIGIAFGSLLCDRLLRGYARATPVPLAALGMSLCGFDLYGSSMAAIARTTPTALTSLADFAASGPGLHVLADLFGLALCGGFFIVPLYTLLQTRADKAHGARAIAANNLVNALFMVGAAGLAVLLLTLGCTIPQIFLITATLNIFVAIYICKLLPFSIIGALLKLVYRVEITGIAHYFAAGDRVLIVANHTSFLDAALIAAFLPERVTFAVNTFVAQNFWMKHLLSMVDTFPLDPTNPLATKSLIDTLKHDRKCMIFPEGRITVTGTLMKVYEGPGMIADKSGATILPIRIDGAQYSPFSRLKGKVRLRLFPRITLTIMPPRKLEIPAEYTGRKRRQMAGELLYDLMRDMMFHSSQRPVTLLQSLCEARRIHGGKHIIVEDQARQPLNYAQLIARSCILARALRRLTKDAPAPRLGLLLPNTIAAVTGFFAMQALGRAAAMLNYSASPAQILSACRAAQLRHILTSRRFIAAAKLESLLTTLSIGGITPIYLEDIHFTLTDRIYGLGAHFWPEAVLRLTGKPPADAAAVVLFTSGSEGMPKGVVLSHMNILANRHQLGSCVDFGPQDIVFNCLPIFHSFGLTAGTMLPLLAGIKVFFYPSPLHYRIVPELIYDTNATILFGTDTFLSGYARFAHPYDFHALRYVFAGAERVKETTRKIWGERFGLRIFEGYGATETAPVLCVNTPMHFRAGTVGRFMPGIAHRLDSVPGIDRGQRLSVQGPNIMLGYLKEDLPGVLQPLANGWYDTGDIVAIDAEGFVTILGRSKRFAKIGGEMVSLTAVENAVNTVWPEGNHAVVSIPDPRKGEAIILVSEVTTIDISILPDHFRRLGLNELALPRHLVTVDKLPLLGTGKADYIQTRALVIANFDMTPRSASETDATEE